MFDLVVRNGLVVTSEASVHADVAVTGERIAAIGDPGSFPTARREVNAAGKLVLPGLIDTHVHMAHPFRGQPSDDDFYTGTVAAAHGGTTSVIEFAIQWDKSQRLPEVIAARKAKAEQDVVVDFSFHGTPTKPGADTIASVAECVKLGVTSFKVYMVYRNQGRMADDALLLALIEEMKAQDGLMMVHAENCAICEANEEAYVAAGKTEARYFPLAKGNLVEGEAIHRALYLNRMVEGRLFIAHLSTREGLASLREARGRGELAFAETCPQYLALTDGVYSRPDGINFLCSPPVRSPADVDAMWRGVAEGVISVVNSDHCGFGLKMKALGNGDFSQTPNGMPGVETRLPVVYTEGVLKGRISLNRMVDVLSTSQAKLFGLYPRKGALLPGSDADIAIVDPEAERVITAAALHGATDWTPFEGLRARGFATATILRGKVIVENGALAASRGSGKFLQRQAWAERPRV
jgi:dihydropyrimidinase